jgi:hypothetical protein
VKTRRAWRDGPKSWLWGVLSSTDGALQFYDGVKWLDDAEAYRRSVDEAIQQGMVFTTKVT